MISMRTFDEDGCTYEWCGGFGAVIKSRERGVSVGDLRVIAGTRLYAYLVYPSWFKRSEVCWTFEQPSIEHIRAFQKHVFGISE